MRRGGRRARRGDDRGTSLVEILVAIVLLGTVVVGTLTALRMAILGSRLERDHARAQEWLQSAIGSVNVAPRRACDPAKPAGGEEEIRLGYQSDIRNDVANPPGWEDKQLTVLKPVKIWDGYRYWDPNDPAAPGVCFDSNGFRLQLITIQVTSPDGRILETTQVVKDG